MNLRLWGSAVLACGVLVACDKDPVEPEPPEPTMFTVTIENVSTAFSFASSGVFNTPVGADAPGPLLPGATYEAEFNAPPGSYLTFATMMVQSNDLFYAPDEMGIPLWKEGEQTSGDVTDYIQLWDAGTEADQEPGLGADQAPRQAAGNTGEADENNTVRLADDTFGNLPPVSDVIQATLTPTGPTSFKLSIMNVSTATTLTSSDGSMHPVPMAPGVYVVHSAAGPLFTVGEADRGEGLEGVAEDGAAGGLGDVLAAATGVTGVIAPGVFAVHTSERVLFADGTADRGDGLEALAEDGDPAGLAGVVAATAGVSESGVFNTPVGAAGPGPVTPGGSYSFEFEAEEGDGLSFATMFVQSNDLFYAPSDQGIALFSGGRAISGDITAQVMLWDAGTEVNEAPGVGPNQAPRQAGPNTGADEAGTVMLVSDGYTYPANASVIRVTITPSS